MADTDKMYTSVAAEKKKMQLLKGEFDALDGSKADKATVAAGDYNKVTVNSQGIVTGGSNPTTLAGHGIQDAYTKTEVNGLVDTPHQNYVTVQATDQTTAATDVLPASGQAADTIYRVSNWDGSANNGAGAFDVTVYSEYAWDDVSNPNKYVFLAVKTQIGEVFDISVYNNNATYPDLSAALGTNGANVPADIRRGGMSVKFVHSVDNKYVQYRLMKTTWSRSVSDWQGVDDNITPDSNDLAKSGKVWDMFSKQSVINLAYMANTRPSGLQIGEYYYNTSTKEIVYLKGENNILSFTPTLNGLYRYGNAYYHWNGSDLVIIDSVLVTLLFLNNLRMTQGGISTSGNNNSISTQIRVGDEVYVDGQFNLELPEGFQFRRLAYYSKANKTFLGYVDINSKYASIGMYNNSECYTRFSIRKQDDSDIVVSDLLSNNFAQIVWDELLYYIRNVSYNVILDVGSMQTGNGVGDTATFVVTQPSNWYHKKIQVKAGDIYYVDSAKSGMTVRAVTITDTNAIIKKIINTDVSSSTEIYSGFVFIEQDGYLVINGTSTTNVGIKSPHEVFINSTLKVLDTAGLFHGGLSPTGAVAITDSQIYTGDIYEKTTLEMPDGYLVRRRCYYDSETGAFDSYKDINSKTVSIGKDGCFARISIKKEDDGLLKPVDFPVNNVGAKVQKNSDNISILCGIRPYVTLKTDYSLGNFSDDIAGMNFDLPRVGTDYMEKLYAKIDTLIQNNSDYITKYDAAVLANIPYPEYANGVETEGTYLVTPAYKTYIYKLSYNNSNIYSDGMPKQKMFITACTHGWETAGSFNAYLLMKGLCEKFVTDEFYMKLRASFDIWILPCLNGYGIYHGIRQNGNGVNINRNAPTSDWYASGSPGDRDYSGPSAGSEFETQLIMFLADYIKPDVFIDHHNFDSEKRLTYTEGWSEMVQNPSFNSFVEINHCMLKNLPAYFGTKFDIFQKKESSPYDLPVSLGVGFGKLSEYLFEKGTAFSFTLEICNKVPFLNGVYVTTNTPNDNDTFRVGEYILRNQLMHYINAMSEYYRIKDS